MNFDHFLYKETKDGFDMGYNQTYLGVSLVLATGLGRHFRLDGNVGLGTSLFDDDGTRRFTTGTRLSVGMEYRFGKFWGVGAEVVEHYSRYGKDNKNRYGLPFERHARMALLLGVRFYPKFE